MTLSHFEVGSVNTALTGNVCCCRRSGCGHPVLSFVMSTEINFSLGRLVHIVDRQMA